MLAANNPSNKVNIYVWSPKDKNVGHVSLETFRGGEKNQGIYMSLYPHPAEKVTITHGYRLYSPFFHTYEDDLRAHEDSPPDNDILTLSTLNVDQINKHLLK